MNHDNPLINHYNPLWIIIIPHYPLIIPLLSPYFLPINTIISAPTTNDSVPGPFRGSALPGQGIDVVGSHVEEILAKGWPGVDQALEISNG